MFSETTISEAILRLTYIIDLRLHSVFTSCSKSLAYPLIQSNVTVRNCVFHLRVLI